MAEAFKVLLGFAERIEQEEAGAEAKLGELSTTEGATYGRPTDDQDSHCAGHQE
jgi:hypothetical protein